MEVYRFSPGETPLLVSVPHAGTHLPEPVAERMTEAARRLPDTDWHVDRLYEFAADLGAGVLVATHSRYVVDLNRPPDGRPLYAGADNTELCPLTLFDRAPVYRPGGEPDEAEVAARRERYWRPYHDKLADELARLRRAHGVALLFDAHSIRSRVPRFFAGRLPDLNLGTAGGSSADPGLESGLAAVCENAEGYRSVLNGRFTGGHITRRYGDPAGGVHAVQLELVQATYMDEDPPFAFRDDLAARLRPTLRRLLEAMLTWAARTSGRS